MKNLIVLIVFMLIMSNISSQHIVPYYSWSSPMAFKLSPSPRITGWGPLTDSLAKAHHDSTFYEYDGRYYPITCWADYYLWYVNKFWYEFANSSLYEYYYAIGDDHMMAYYISNFFIGFRYPSYIAVKFPGEFCTNNLSRRKVKQNIKNNNRENKRYVPADDATKQKKRKSILPEIAENGNVIHRINRDEKYINKKDRLKKSDFEKQDRTTVNKTSHRNLINDKTSIERIQSTSTSGSVNNSVRSNIRQVRETKTEKPVKLK